jgi:E3 ubiquitin-protein ligase SHPRH
VHLARHAAEGARALRRPKRYRVADSPLSALRWWRLLLDEAQNVGDGFSQARCACMHASLRCALNPPSHARLLRCSQVGDMAAMLRARARWVVTGTPMGAGGLRDLHGLLRVLGHAPFADRRVWLACVQRPYERGARLSSLRSC